MTEVVATETANHGAILVTMSLAVVGLVLGVMTSKRAVTRIVRSEPADFAVGSSRAWLTALSVAACAAGLVWFLMLGHVGSSSFTYDSDGPLFWVWRGPLLVLVGTFGPLSWYVLDARRRSH